MFKDLFSLQGRVAVVTGGSRGIGRMIAAGPREFALARSIGFKTAVTTRPGMIFPESADHLTALQRVSLNGNYQDERIIPVLTSGAATAMWNGFRRIDAA